MLPQQADEKAFQYYRRLRRLGEYLRSNIDRPIPRDEAASVAGLAPDYFSKWFRHRAGVSYSSWLAECRLRHAEELF